MIETWNHMTNEAHPAFLCVAGKLTLSDGETAASNHRVNASKLYRRNVGDLMNRYCSTNLGISTNNRLIENRANCRSQTDPRHSKRGPELSRYVATVAHVVFAQILAADCEDSYLEIYISLDSYLPPSYTVCLCDREL